MKLVIDIGSNTIKCLLGEITVNQEVRVIYEESLESRICDGHTLVPNASKKIIDSINHFTQKSNSFSCAFDVQIVATSALRDASNQSEILETVKEATGFDITILSPSEEVDLSFLGAMTDVAIDKSKELAFFDLGGGSLEIAFGDKNGVNSSISLPIGAVRLTKKFIKNPDEPTKSEIEQISEFVKSKLSSAIKSKQDFSTLVGVGGAVVAARFMQKKMGLISKENIVELDNLKKIIKLILSKTVEERVKDFDISHSRADILPAAFLTIEAVMEALNCSELTHTFRNLRYGIIKEEIYD